MPSPTLEQPAIVRWREAIAELRMVAVDPRQWLGRLEGLEAKAVPSAAADGTLHVELSIALDGGPEGLVLVGAEHSATLPQAPTGDTSFDAVVSIGSASNADLGPVYACLDSATRRRLSALVPRGLVVADGRLSVPHRLTMTAATTPELVALIKDAAAVARALSTDTESRWEQRFIAIAMADPDQAVQSRYQNELASVRVQELTSVFGLQQSIGDGEFSLVELQRALASDRTSADAKAHLVAVACRHCPVRAAEICTNMSDSLCFPLLNTEMMPDSPAQLGAFRALSTVEDLSESVVSQVLEGTSASLAQRLSNLATAAQLEPSRYIVAGRAVELLALALHRRLREVVASESPLVDRYELMTAQVLSRAHSTTVADAFLSMRTDAAVSFVFSCPMSQSALTALIKDRIGTARAVRLFSLWQTHAAPEDNVVSKVAQAIVGIVGSSWVAIAVREAMLGALCEEAAWSHEVEVWVRAQLDDPHLVDGAIMALAKFGSLACIEDLAPRTKGLFRAGSEKKLAEAAIKAIQERAARKGAGALSVATTPTGDLSLTGEGEDVS